MRIYLRKITDNDTKKQIETTAEAYEYFFGGNVGSELGVVVTIENHNGTSKRDFRISKAAGNANSYRFSAAYAGERSFATFINENVVDGYKANDVLKIENRNGRYFLSIVKDDDDEYNTLLSMIPKKQNTIIYSDHTFSNESGDLNKKILIRNLKGYNKIFYGIPGCGKSYYVEHKVLDNVDKQKNVFRTTFYLDYSNSDFIGQIYPHVEVNDKGEKIVTYKNVPGPFTKALKRAFEAPNDMIYLVIEEINRGNAAAIFGDTFQLLDRLQENYDGRIPGDSEYPISNEFIESYLGDLVKKGQVFIPHNLTILATMNTSDQNVFPLDTAFKRRWDMEKVVNDWSICDLAKLCIPFTDITWENFAKTINVRMIQANENGEVIINEDKKLGAYFATKDMLVEKEKRHDDTPENRAKLKKFVTNVVDYLFNDVTKFDHTALFKEKVSFDDIYSQVLEYELTEHDIDVFHNVFKEKVEPDVKDDE